MASDLPAHLFPSLLPQPRFFIRRAFNPSSSKQVIGAIKALGQQPGRNRKSQAESSDADTLARLARQTDDPFYRTMLEQRALEKLQGTYVQGMLERLGADDRLHPTFGHNPSTLRLSCSNPNLQNMAADEDDPWAVRFRENVVASAGCNLLYIDYCVSPATKILKADLTWACARDLRKGDALIGFDEKLGGHSHKYRESKVLAVKKIIRPRIRVVTSHGSTVVSAEHRFVARTHKHKREWVQAKDLRVGQQMAFFNFPWETDRTYDGAYLAGFLDGEGWVSHRTLGYGQNPGLVLNHVRRLLKDRGFRIGIHTGRKTSTASCEVLEGTAECLRLLGSIRPKRLLLKAKGKIWNGMRTWGRHTPIVRVLGVYDIGAGPVIAIKTTTKTFISDGYFSHNCAIEAIITGWYTGDPDYIRLAVLGVHDYVNSHYLARVLKLIPEPASLKWSDADLSAFFADLKKRFGSQRKRVKHAVHGRNYWLSAYGLNRQYPEWFPSVAAAEEVLRVYDECAPKVGPWQIATAERAYKQGYLGGPLRQHSTASGDWYRELMQSGGHPFGYRHWFWHIKDFKKITPSQAKEAQAKGKPVAQIGTAWFSVSWGDDAKRAVAFYPQSTAAGVIAEAILRLFRPGESEHFIGDAYFGKTPLRAQVHDALLLEVPFAQEERVLRALAGGMACVVKEMPCPPEWRLGDYLKIGVAVKRGRNWSEPGMETVKLEEAA